MFLLEKLANSSLQCLNEYFLGSLNIQYSHILCYKVMSWTKMVYNQNYACESASMGYLLHLRSLKQPRLISYSYDMSITFCLGDSGPHHPHGGSLRETSSLCFCPYQMQEKRNRADLTLTPKVPFQMLHASLLLIYQWPEQVTCLYLTSRK